MSKKIRIVGAGFSGLATAFFLSKKGYEIEIFDRKDSVGGLLNTTSSKFGLMESAANGFMNSELVEDVFLELGLELQGTRPVAKKRYIVIKKASRFPLSLMEALLLAFKVFWGLLRFGKNYFKPFPNEDILSWGGRCLGLPMTKKVLAPALQGVYSGDSKRLSASLIIGKYFNKSSKPQSNGKKSKLKFRGTVAPKFGMSQMTAAFKAYLENKGVKFHLGQENLKFDSTYEYILAGSAHDTAKFLETVAPETSKKLAGIDLLPIVSTTLFFEPDPRQLQGFGCLFSRESEYRPLGVLFNDGIFENRSVHRSETWICGGALDRDVLNLSDDVLLKMLLDARRKLLGIDQSPLHYQIHRWPKAIPHYDLYLENVLKEKLNLPKGIHLIGNYLGLIGLGKILEQAQELSENI